MSSHQEEYKSMNNAKHVMIGIYEKALPSSMTWAERLETAARAGFDFIELSIDENSHRLGRLDWPPARRTRLRELIASSPTSIASICLSGHRKYPMGSATPRIRQIGLDMLQKAVAFAQDVGVRMVLVPGYDVFYEVSDEHTRARFLEGLREGLVWASQARVTLALENTDHSITSITQALWYVRQLESPWLRVYADVGNLVAAGHEPLTELEAAAGYLAGVHIKDAVAGEFRHISFGEGAVPFVPIFRKLWDIQFDGPITLEMWHDRNKDALSAVAGAHQWVQARIEESYLPLAPSAAGIGD